MFIGGGVSVPVDPSALVLVLDLCRLGRSRPGATTDGGRV